jgi:hypothetical protein
MLTNKSGLPDALVRAVMSDTYSKGDSDYSVTELLKSPRQVALAKIHKDSLTEDVADRIWSLYGQVAHLILERANLKDISETRYFGSFLNKRISAQIDHMTLDGSILTDWKFVTAWKFKVGKPVEPEWESQLNMQLELLRMNGLDAKQIQIIGLLRDWSKLEAERVPDYPKKGVIVAPVEIWPRKRTVAFIEERITLHEATRGVRKEDLPLCSDSERWAKPACWAVMKGERAIRYGVCFSEEEALSKQGLNPGTRVEFRRGESVKCRAYCNVSEFCSQYKTIKESL